MTSLSLSCPYSPPLQPSTKLKAGVVHGQDLIDLMEHAQKTGYAIPAVNCTSSSITNAVMEAAKVGEQPSGLLRRCRAPCLKGALHVSPHLLPSLPL